MPKLKKYIEKTCFHCDHYKVTIYGAYCEHFKQTFPDAGAWAHDKTKKKPGERTCPNWRG